MWYSSCCYNSASSLCFQSAISDLKKEITDVKKDLGGRVDDLTRAMKALVKTTEVTMLKKATVMEIRYEVFVQEIKGRLAFANIPQQGEGNLPNFVPLHDLENVNMVGLPRRHKTTFSSNDAKWRPCIAWCRRWPTRTCTCLPLFGQSGKSIWIPSSRRCGTDRWNKIGE